eukprot:TRINITY_DN1015_c0_g1_i3.p1 TRINITY_DN1015_c0_g1~~TRINITY_DN1015_c0_g1_i3.p1  ORF type:complete len:248 (-),score=40.55 TRINITY_DN1015_c0_g1_i3:78-722(-)
MVLGLGSGSTIVYAIERLGQRVLEENLDVICIPTSFQSKQLALKYNLRLSDLSMHPNIDVTIDGADEIDTVLNLIKGGGGALLQEKIVAYNSKEFVVIADYRKTSNYLGEKWKSGVPIEVIPLAYVPVKNKIESTLGGNAVLRMAVAKAGPVVTDNGNFILDVNFDWKNLKDLKQLDDDLLRIPGIVGTGFFLKMAKIAYIGKDDGTILILNGN